MNDESFDRKLTEGLRNVRIPKELHAELLELSRQPCERPGPLPAPDEIKRPLRGNMFARGQHLWAKATVLAGIVAGLWLGWSLLRTTRSTEMAKKAMVQAPDWGAVEGQTQLEFAAEIEQMRAELKSLERAYQELEQEELASEASQRIDRGDMPSPMTVAEWGKAEAIFWTAETSVFSGQKTEGVREQLRYLIKEFPDSAPAQRATVLLADF